MNLKTRAKQTQGPTAHQMISLATLRRNSAPLEGYGAVPVQLRLAQGPVAPSSEVLRRSRAGRPLERGPVSIESQAPPRASFRLARGYHGPAASISAPPVGAFTALTFAGVQVKCESTPLRAWNHALALLRQLPWRSRPHHCALLCGGVSNNPVALCHPLPYGRRTAPSEDHVWFEDRWMVASLCDE
jgi:hypothetical protein